MSKLLISVVVVAGMALVVGCEQQAANTAAKDAAPSAAKPEGSVPAAPAAAPATEVPADRFLAAAPESPRELRDARGEAKVGDKVVLHGRIGGRKEPFVDGRAVFLLADARFPTCRERHGDGCPTPWDYCCEDPKDLMAGLATVQLVDADGKPLAVSLRGVHGLEPMAEVQVVGTVKEADDVFVIDAEKLFVVPRS